MGSAPHWSLTPVGRRHAAVPIQILPFGRALARSPAPAGTGSFLGGALEPGEQRILCA
jgi:hypothetical protein